MKVPRCPHPSSLNPGLLTKEWFSVNLSLSAETFERVCLKAREINSKEKCLFKMYVLCGHSGEGKGAAQSPGCRPPRGTWGPGCGLQPRQGPGPLLRGRDVSWAAPAGLSQAGGGKGRGLQCAAGRRRSLPHPVRRGGVPGRACWLARREKSPRKNAPSSKFRTRAWLSSPPPPQMASYSAVPNE